MDQVVVLPAQRHAGVEVGFAVAASGLAVVDLGDFAAAASEGAVAAVPVPDGAALGPVPVSRLAADVENFALSPHDDPAQRGVASQPSSRLAAQGDPAIQLRRATGSGDEGVVVDDDADGGAVGVEDAVFLEPGGASFDDVTQGIGSPLGSAAVVSRGKVVDNLLHSVEQSWARSIGSGHGIGRPLLFLDQFVMAGHPFYFGGGQVSGRFHQHPVGLFISIDHTGDGRTFEYDSSPVPNASATTGRRHN